MQRSNLACTANVDVLKQAERVCEARRVRRPRPLIVLALAAAVAGCGAGDTAARGLESPGQRARLAAEEHALARESPPRLAHVYAQRGQILGGGLRAFRARLAELRGYPVVVNKWASWCAPCRTELPFFRHQALARGRAIAFLGSNSEDTPNAARRFLGEIAIPYPSYEDRDSAIARFFEGAIAFPSTAIYDRHGRLATVKQGVYESERDLAADITRYAR